MNPFHWLRSAVKAAVLGGVADALAEIQPKPAALEIEPVGLAPVPALKPFGGDEDEQPKRRAK